MREGFSDWEVAALAALWVLPLAERSIASLAAIQLAPIALAGVTFRKDKIRLDPSIHAAAEANELVVKEGIPFREAYRRVGEKLTSKS